MEITRVLSMWCVLLLLLTMIYALLLVFCYKDIPVGRNESEDNSTSTHVIFESAWFNKMVAYQERCHYTTPVNKHIN